MAPITATNTPTKQTRLVINPSAGRLLPEPINRQRQMDLMTMAAVTVFGIIPGAIVLASIVWQLWDQSPWR